MSRLYGRAFDVYKISGYLGSSKIPNYACDNHIISLDELIDSSAILDFYLPDKAVDYIVKNPIHIMKSPLFPRNMSSFPSEKDPNATIFFKCLKYKEEQKRELVFFLGCLLSHLNPDELPKNDDLPCEYGELFPLLLEYLYLKEENQEDRFLLKHLNSLKYHSAKYQKTYEKYHKQLVTDRNKELDFVSETELDIRESNKLKNEKEFLTSTFNMLVPFSSVDGVLQVIDKFKSEDEIKKLIKELFENKGNNRQEILDDKGISSFGYKTLRKEIDKIGKQR